jgi:hypothetical protein
MKRLLILLIMISVQCTIDCTEARAESYFSTIRSRLSSLFNSAFGVRREPRLNMNRASGVNRTFRQSYGPGLQNRNIRTVLNRSQIRGTNGRVLGFQSRNRMFASRGRVSGFRPYRGR